MIGRMFQATAAIIIGVLIGMSGSGTSPANAADDVDAVVVTLHRQFDRVDQKLLVAPVLVVDGWALAGWTQGEMGGRALLRRDGTTWQIRLCAGDAIVTPTALRDAGIAPATADRLSAGMIAAEAREPKDRIAMFSRFQGVAPMESGHDHRR